MLKHAEGEILPTGVQFFGGEGIYGNGALPDFLDDNISAFGGVMPADPVPEWCVYTQSTDYCYDADKIASPYRFGSFRYDKLSGTYLFAITAHVENEENGNNSVYNGSSTVLTESGPYYVYFGTR